jgi:hypothetical protein
MIIVTGDKCTEQADLIPPPQTRHDRRHRFILFDDVVRLREIPSAIVPGRDTKFTSRFWQTLFERFGTKLAISSAYHPLTEDGQSERMVRTLKEILRSAGDHRQTDWTRHLAALEFGCSNAVPASTHLTPFELNLGYQPRTPYSFLTDDMLAVQTVNDIFEDLEAFQHLANIHIEHARLVRSKAVN